MSVNYATSVITNRLQQVVNGMDGGGASGSMHFLDSGGNILATVTLDFPSGTVVGNTLTFNGAAETDGRFSLSSGAGTIDFTGGNKGDSISLGAGNDTVRYSSVAQSTSTNYDTVTGFDFNADHFDVAGSVTSVLTGSGHLVPGNFDATLATAMNGLLVQNSAVLFTADASSGSLANGTACASSLACCAGSGKWPSPGRSWERSK